MLRWGVLRYLFCTKNNPSALRRQLFLNDFIAVILNA